MVGFSGTRLPATRFFTACLCAFLCELVGCGNPSAPSAPLTSNVDLESESESASESESNVVAIDVASSGEPSLNTARARLASNKLAAKESEPAAKESPSHSRVDAVSIGAGSATASTAPSLDDLDDLPEAVRERQEIQNELGLARKNRDDTIWKNETLAQEYEQAFVRVWDALLAQDRREDGDKFKVLANLAFEKISLGKRTEKTRTLDHGIQVIELQPSDEWTLRDDWQVLLADWKAVGYRLIQSEFHHAKFDPPTENGQAKSSIAVAFYLTREQPEQRIVVKGHVDVIWQPRIDNELPVAQTIDASKLSIWTRNGAPAFREIATVDHTTPATRAGVQPVIVYDLNGDGLSEILLGGSNELLQNEGSGNFKIDQLCSHGERIFETGLVADLNGDGRPDYVTPGIRGDLLLYLADPDGKFSQPPLGKARGGGPLRQPQVMTAGDIDQDGDLDLWIAQYKISYVGGQMPTPYYDANDGFPAYLLLNDGKGRFEPMTEEAGLAPKRNRRTYGSSFVDLDTDGDLDLLVVSDFSGIDLYLNNGKGYFEDVTDKMFDERHLFGMSVSFADYDLDGQTDFFVSGMASTTARRLEYMRLGRRDRPDIHMMRSRMGYGNRMYVAKEDRYVEPEFKDEVARTGWTWGATSFDFDNDGDKDIFVANGHSSGTSTKDHCSHFWCHDIYDANSKPDLMTDSLFKDVMKGYFDRSESWDGYQKNVLLMNDLGQSFSSIGFLMGIGHQYDGRAVVGDDLDGDGRVDLLVVEDRWQEGQILHVYRNELQTQNRWIGFRLREEGAKVSPIGARIVLETTGKQQTVNIVTGDSIHAQHAPTVHFGLGKVDDVSSATVHWPNGEKTTLEKPAANQYHEIRLKK